MNQNHSHVSFPRGNDSEWVCRLRRAWIAALCSAGLMVATPSVRAANTSTPDPTRDYPNRPIRYILPNGPGSNADIFTRILAQKLSEHFGQQVVVDSRPGAGGMLGIDIAAKSALHTRGL